MTAPVATPDLLTRAMQTLRQSGFTDDQIMQMPRNPTMGIAALRRAGWNDNDLLLLGQMVPPQNPQPDPQAQLQQLLGIVLQAQPDATKQKKREPERITAQWRPAEMRSAQPGQVPVTNQMVQRQQVGQVRQWAQEQANDPRVVAGMVADVLPGIGDIKAGWDAVGLFRSGHPLAGALVLASMLPAIPNLKGLKSVDIAKTVGSDVPTMARLIDELDAAGRIEDSRILANHYADVVGVNRPYPGFGPETSANRSRSTYKSGIPPTEKQPKQFAVWQAISNMGDGRYSADVIAQNAGVTLAEARSALHLLERRGLVGSEVGPDKLLRYKRGS